jgi:fumarate reductase subunit C
MRQFSVSSHKGEVPSEKVAPVFTLIRDVVASANQINSVSAFDFYLKLMLIFYLTFMARPICEGDMIFRIIFAIFNVFHVRALYHTKTLITNKCTKRVLSSVVTHSYMFRPCWVIFRENFSLPLLWGLHFIVEWECAVDCVLRCATLA